MILYLHRDYNGDFTIDKRVDSEFYDFVTIQGGIGGNTPLVEVYKMAKNLGAKKLILDF